MESPKTRGAAGNPLNRFERIEYVPDPDAPPEDRPDPRTVFLRDSSRSIISRNDSPDLGFETSVNPYRGCEHGCTYCFARPTHEYLGLSIGLDFETKILVKERAPELLKEELSAKSWRPQTLVMSGVTDPYQPIERKLELTRRCLRVLAEFGNPVGIITKSALVARDADLLASLASFGAARVNLSITTLDEELARAMEPRAASPANRLRAVEALAKAGVPVCVGMAPVIPGLNDHELPRVLEAAARAGARGAFYTVLRLPHGLKELFSDWLERAFPQRKDKVLNQLRGMRGGKLYDSRFGVRARGAGGFSDDYAQLFALARRRFGLDGPLPALSTARFRRPSGPQLELF